MVISLLFRVCSVMRHTNWATKHVDPELPFLSHNIEKDRETLIEKTQSVDTINQSRRDPGASSINHTNHCRSRIVQTARSIPISPISNRRVIFLNAWFDFFIPKAIMSLI